MWRRPDWSRRGDPLSKLAWVVRRRGGLQLEDTRRRRQASADGRATVRHNDLYQSLHLSFPSLKSLQKVQLYLMPAVLMHATLPAGNEHYMRKKKNIIKTKKKDPVLQPQWEVIVKNICSRVVSVQAQWGVQRTAQMFLLTFPGLFQTITFKTWQHQGNTSVFS